MGDNALPVGSAFAYRAQNFRIFVQISRRCGLSQTARGAALRCPIARGCLASRRGFAITARNEIVARTERAWNPPARF
jgi:hypothetical protein